MTPRMLGDGELLVILFDDQTYGSTRAQLVKAVKNRTDINVLLMPESQHKASCKVVGIFPAADVHAFVVPRIIGG